MSLMLGKKAPKFDKRTLQFEKYLRPRLLPSVPTALEWGQGIPADSWGMMNNDTVGDCTAAALGHLIEEWTEQASGTAVVIPDSEILAAYSAVSGYKPGAPATDVGATLIDTLNYWRKTGCAGHTITAYTQLQITNYTPQGATATTGQLKEAVFLFGATYIGLQLPVSAQNQFEQGQAWSIAGNTPDARPGSWGGHCVPILGYTPHQLHCVTWGQVQSMTWGFFKRYCDEAYAVLSDTTDWFNAGKAPSGFDFQTLESDLVRLIRS